MVCFMEEGAIKGKVHGIRESHSSALGAILSSCFLITDVRKRSPGHHVASSGAEDEGEELIPMFC